MRSIISRLKRPMWLVGLAGPVCLLLAGCASDPVELAGCASDPVEPADDSRKTPVELLSFSTPFLDVAPWITRADPEDPEPPEFHFAEGYQTNHLPTGYTTYETLHPRASVDDSTIGVFMAPNDINPSGDFIYQGIADGISVWNSSVVVEKDKQYYIYGFMPHSGAETASITSPNGTGGDDFANGAVIMLQDFPALTTADVSVIVGLRWASADEKINGIPAEGSDVPLGNFKYTGMEEHNNCLFVLLEHIYAGLHFALKLDPTYHALRNICITKVELTAKDITPKVNLRITLNANTEGKDPLTNVEYQTSAVPVSDNTITLYEKAAGDLGVKVPDDSHEDFLGCLVPGSTSSFVLRTTYDVYDRNATSDHPEGNLIRKGCVAENKINPNTVLDFPTLRRGQLFTVNLLIRPTYLLMLSDPDLDKPEIVLTTTP